MSLKLNVTSVALLGSPAPDEPGTFFKSMCHVPSSDPKIKMIINNVNTYHFFSLRILFLFDNPIPRSSSKLVSD